MKIVVIASGSSGNATYIETKAGVKILIDAGVSYAQIVKRLKNQGITLGSLDAIIISHEHTDHTKSLSVLLEETGATLYINKLSYNNLEAKILNSIEEYPITFIQEEVRYQIKDLMFMPLLLSHDAANTFGFVFENEGKSLGYITDTGVVPLKYLPILARMNVLIIESNHDVEMLMNSRRHWSLKRRILSPYGHLSNQMCSEILRSIISEHTKYVILAHISKECNSYELAYHHNIKNLKDEHQIELLVARQEEELEIITL